MSDGGHLPQDFSQLPDSSLSLLKKYLTPEIWADLKDRKTAAGVTLHDCIRSGLANPDSLVGLYAGDAESYEVFAPLFTPVIAACHAGPPESPVAALANPDPEGAYIVSTRIRFARNLRGHVLRPVAIREMDLEVERAATAAFAHFSGDFAGRYWPLSEAPGFSCGDRFQDAAGLNRHWPHGRGVFANTAQTFFVWVNEEDHLRFISVAPNADFAGAYARLCAGVETAARSLAFQRTDHLGYITSCPTNLGPALRVGFRIQLPRSGGSPAFETICRDHRLTVRAIAGEGAPLTGRTYDISKRGRLGVSEIAVLAECLEGARRLITLEKRAVEA